MNKPIITLMLLATILCSCHAQEKASSSEPVAVIELFSSEGCSSCPPADKILAHYAQDSVYHRVKTFPIAFHVDYWNYLGWRDSFSSAEFTARQSMYVDALRLNGAYTPQEIVNGTTQFVGSDEEALQNALNKISKSKSLAAFTNLQATTAGNKLNIQYALQGDIKNCEIHFALISLEVSTQVRRGENVGRKLTHHNVVRRFITERANTSGEIVFSNNTLPTNNTAVVAYVQDVNSKKIVAAARVGL